MKFSFSYVMTELQARIPDFAVILALMILAIGCRKDDTEYPVLNAQITSGGTTFDFGESVPFTISATDNEGVEEVGVVVLDASGVPVLSAVQTQAGGAESYTWNSSVDHLNPYLATGTYTARFFASDGDNITYAFRTITLNTLPLQLEKVLLFEPQGLTTSVSAINTSGDKIAETTLDADVRVAAADNRNGQLLVGGLEWEGILLLDKNTYNVNHSLPTPSLSSPELFTSVVYSFDRNRHYVACNDGVIREIGSASVTGLIDLDGWIPESMMINGNEMLVSLTDITGNEHGIGFVNLSSGQLIEFLETDIHVKAFLVSGENDPWVLGNGNGSFVVRRLDRDLPSLYDPDGISGPSDISPVRDALVLPSGNWLVMQDSGCRLYSAGASGSGTYICPVAVRAIYELTEDVIYLALDDEILVYRENVGVLTTIGHNGNLPWVIPVYNK